MHYTWNWGIFLQPSPDGQGTYLDTFVWGLGWTLATSLGGWCIALVLGSLVGVARTTERRWLATLAHAYVELFRNIPLIVQMFLWFFVLPELLPASAGMWLKRLPNAAFYNAVVALGFFTSARVAEQVRAGIQSIPRGQWMAAKALGLSATQTYRHVLLPRAFRAILPPLTSELMNVVKNSAVGLSIGLLELTGRARAMQEFSFQVFEAFAAATLGYLLVTLSIVFGMRWLERKVAVPGFITHGAQAGTST